VKVIYNKLISKDGNMPGKTLIKKIKSCMDCHWKYQWKCDLTGNYLNEDNSIPDYCPLEDWKEKL